MSELKISVGRGSVVAALAVLVLAEPSIATIYNVPGDFPTIQAAIVGVKDGDEIVVAPGSYNEAIDFLGKAITVRSSDGPDVTTIDATGLDHATIRFNSDEGPDTVLDGFTITGGIGEDTGNFRLGGGLYIFAAAPTIRHCSVHKNVSDWGGGAGIRNSSGPTFEFCSFEDNVATIRGGGVSLQNGSPVFTDCSFQNNSATLYGGGLSSISAPLAVLLDCTFTANQAGRGGGAHLSGNFQVTDCLFQLNTADDAGGCFVGFGDQVFTGCVFAENTVSEVGGGLHTRSPGQIQINGCQFIDNQAVEGGGTFVETPFYDDDGPVTFTDCIISGNTASIGAGMSLRGVDSTTLENCQLTGNDAVVRGGAMHLEQTSPQIISCTFNSNTADPFFGEGGAIYSGEGSEPIFMDSTFASNTAGLGGAVSTFFFSDPAFEGCVFDGNSADRGGAAHNFIEANASFTGCSFTSNTAQSEGGALWNRLSTIDLQACVLQDNWAEYGGGIFNRSSTVALSSVTFTANEANLWGGGMYSTEGSVTDLVGCTFESNQAVFQGGGGLYFDQCENQDQPMMIVDCIFRENVGNGPGIVFSSDCYANLLECAVTNNHNSTEDNNGAISGGQVLMENCLIAANIGPGTYAFSSSTHELRECSIQNDALFSSGLLTVRDCTFANGGVTALFSGTTHVQDCTFDPGQLFAVSGATLLMSDCIIRDCSGNQGVYIDGGTAVISNCLIQNCQWGIRAFNDPSSVTVVNSVFTGNEVGLLKIFHDSVRVSNCTFSGNLTAVKDSQGFGEFHIDNSIIADPIDADPADISINYTNVVSGWGGDGIGNISADPLFVDPDNGDYRLMSGSPCIDAGHNWYVPIDENDNDEDGVLCELFPVDLDGNPRFNADEADFDPGCGVAVVVDMGAYEYQFDPADQVTFADLNGDNVVGAADLLGLLASWGPCGKGCCLADIDIDGSVGASDLLALLANWGPCP